MSDFDRATRPRVPFHMLLALLAMVTMMLICWVCVHSSAEADVRRTAPRKSFKSGAARSEPILHEISATLLRIEARLERLEQTVRANSTPHPVGIGPSPSGRAVKGAKKP